MAVAAAGEPLQGTVQVDSFSKWLYSETDLVEKCSRVPAADTSQAALYFLAL